jgi:hypothetical protein
MELQKEMASWYEFGIQHAKTAFSYVDLSHVFYGYWQ